MFDELWGLLLLAVRHLKLFTRLSENTIFSFERPRMNENTYDVTSDTLPTNLICYLFLDFINRGAREQVPSGGS